MRFVQIIPIEFGDREALEYITSGIASILHAETRLLTLNVNIGHAFDGIRHQYNSNDMLAAILDAAPPGRSKLLGVTGHDLFIPVLTFIFGQAQLNNRGAIFSTFRLGNEFYGLPASREEMIQRALKEALHELGHTHGLRHCFDNPCAMNTSTYVEDIDLKPAHYCPACVESLNRNEPL